MIEASVECKKQHFCDFEKSDFQVIKFYRVSWLLQGINLCCGAEILRT